jgi:serine/threonine-protein kinase
MIGHYRIVSRLGAGGVGEVYLAEDTHLKRKVAIKFLLPESEEDERARKRFIREAQAAAKLDHPNICAIHEVGEEDDRGFIVMQYLEGETLAERLKRKALELPPALGVAIQVADALSEAHSHGIIHRDLKPHNIMITARGQAKLLDFGLAKVVTVPSDHVETISVLSTPGLVMGTVPYMSPEQLRGEALDARSDIFSFGALLFEMICGISPFASGNQAEIVSAILTKDPPALARLAPQSPDGLQAVVSKCLDKDRRCRYQTMLDVGADLKKILDECEAGRVIPNVISHYQIMKKLGHGTSGQVHLAQDTRSNRKVAIKVLYRDALPDEGAKRRLIREAAAAAGLDHPNICAIHEVGQDSGLIFVAMQYVEGETLSTKLKRGPLELREVLHIAVQVTEALAEAHSHGIVHRDIKPQNIMITPPGQAKVLDFGLARIAQEGISVASDVETLSLFTEPGIIIGTLPYRSPEQAQGERIDARSDIFSLGVVLYEMISGPQPFAAESVRAMIMAIPREAEPLAKDAGDVQAGLDRIVRKCLEKDRERRYQSTKAIAIDLKKLQQRLQTGGQGRAKRRQLLTAFNPIAPLVVAVMIFVVTAIGLYLLARRGARGDEPAHKLIQSIAVLPFANDGANPSTEYLCDGLTESLIDSFSRLANLKVIARNSVFSLKGQKINVLQVGRDLKVEVVLTGRVRQLGDDLSISAELTDTDNNTNIWGAHYTRRLSDIFSLQEEISKEISDRLWLQLSGDERALLAKRYTNNTEAYELYVKGRQYWNNRTPESLQKAIENFQNATKLDPGFALAHVGLADCYAMAVPGLPPKKKMPVAKEEAMRALEIDNTLGEAYSSLAFISLYFDWQWSEAETRFKRAIELNPNYASAHHWYADYLMVMGRTDEALTQLNRAEELDPLSPIIKAELGLPFFYAHNYDQAIEQHRKAVEDDQNYGPAHYYLGRAYAQKNMYAQALAEYRKAIPLYGGSVPPLALLAHCLALSGSRQEALKVLDDLNNRSKGSYVSPYYLAVIYAGLGERGRAFDYLEKAFEERSGWLVYLKVDPFLESLRSDEKYANLMRRMGL